MKSGQVGFEEEDFSGHYWKILLQEIRLQVICSIIVDVRKRLRSYGPLRLKSVSLYGKIKYQRNFAMFQPSIDEFLLIRRQIFVLIHINKEDRIR